MTKANRKTDPRRAPAHRAVSAYLKLIRSSGGSYEELRSERDEIYAKLKTTTDPVKQLKLIQRRISLDSQLTRARNAERREIKVLANFTEHAKAFAEENGITYSAWRKMGVPVEVLEAAGIQRAPQGRRRKVEA